MCNPRYPFAELGLTPELGSSLVIPFLVGMSKAKEIMMIGEWFSAEDAVRLGLANEVVEPEQLMARATEIATDLTTKQADALRQVVNGPNQPEQGHGCQWTRSTYTIGLAEYDSLYN